MYLLCYSVTNNGVTIEDRSHETAAYKQSNAGILGLQPRYRLAGWTNAEGHGLLSEPSELTGRHRSTKQSARKLNSYRMYTNLVKTAAKASEDNLVSLLVALSMYLYGSKFLSTSGEIFDIRCKLVCRAMIPSTARTVDHSQVRIQ